MEIQDAIFRANFKARGERVQQYMKRAHDAEATVEKLSEALRHALLTKHDIRTCACAECANARHVEREIRTDTQGITEQDIEETRSPQNWREAHKGRE